MFKTSQITLAFLVIFSIFFNCQMAQAQNCTVYINGSDYRAVEILGSLLDNKAGQAGYNVQYSRPTVPHVEIYIEPIDSGWGYSDSSWGVSSWIVHDITRIFTDKYFYIPSAGYYGGGGEDAHYIILSFKIKKPETTLTYFSAGVGTSEYDRDSYYVSGFNHSSYSSTSFGPDFWSRYQAIAEALPSLKTELANVNLTYNTSTTNTAGPTYTTPQTTGYTPNTAPPPRAVIEFRNADNNAISFDQLTDGDTIEVYTEVGAIIVPAGAGSVFVTPLDNQLSYVNNKWMDKNYQLPEIAIEIKNVNTGKYALVIEENRYYTREIKKIYLNFHEPTQIYKNEEIKF